MTFIRIYLDKILFCNSRSYVLFTQWKLYAQAWSSIHFIFIRVLNVRVNISEQVSESLHLIDSAVEDVLCACIINNIFSFIHTKICKNQSATFFCIGSFRYYTLRLIIARMSANLTDRFCSCWYTAICNYIIRVM